MAKYIVLFAGFFFNVYKFLTWLNCSMSYVLGLSFIYLLFQEYDDQGRVIKKKKKGGKVCHNTSL